MSLKKEREVKRKLKYDINEGLLPEIRRACGYPEHREEQPTTSKGAGRKKKQVEEEWKYIEAQICSLCSIGGDILCCETCPASFHLACIGYEASDVPDDNFYCNRCKNLPPDVQLFPPEKCSSVVDPQQRIAAEIKRNWEAIRWQYQRLKEKDPDRDKRTPTPDFGPHNFLDELKSAFPDPCLVKALSMANPMDYNLPSSCLDEKEFHPNDPMENKRPHIVDQICIKCGLKDDWSSMLICDFCLEPWHQNCAYPPLVTVPRVSYWRCPRHPETVVDSLFQGKEISNDDKKRVVQDNSKVDKDWETFLRFCKFTEPLRIATKLKERSLKNDVYYDIDEKKNAESSTSSPLVILKKISRKVNVRGKKKFEQRFFDNAYSVPGSTEQEVRKTSKSLQKAPPAVEPTERDDPVLDELDKKRSIPFTEEELIMSIMPFDEARRNEYLTQKMLGSDMEMSRSFLTRHLAMTSRSQNFYSTFSEKEITRLMRKELDPVETVRGSGVQSYSSTQEKSYRKKFKADAELLMQLLGLNDHSNRRFSSLRTEAFFRRCVPPPVARDVLNQRTLRECALHSQKEAQDVPHVFKYHPLPKNLENLIMIGYDTSFDSAEERNSFFVSSMTPWSKEPIGALTAKWAQEERKFAELVSKQAAQSIHEASTELAEGAAPDSVANSELDKTSPDKDPESRTSSATSDGVKVEEEKEQSVVERDVEEGVDLRIPKEESPSPSEEQNQNSIPPPECQALTKSPAKPKKSPEELFEIAAQRDFKGLKVPEHYWKAESVYELECYDEELDDPLQFHYNLRRTRSESDIVDRPNWFDVQRHIQAIVRRDLVTTEHSYAALYPVVNPSMEPVKQPVRSSVEDVDDEQEDDRESSYSVEFAEPGLLYENFCDRPQRKRGRPIGSKNRKEGEAIPKRKRYSGGSLSSGRGRPRGSKARGGSRSISSNDEGGSSRRQSLALSTDSRDSPEPTTDSSLQKLREDVEATKKKYAKLLVAKTFEESINNYFDTRDDMLLNWTPEQHQQLKERCLMGRMNSLFPFDPRYFLPNQKVYGSIEFSGQYLPIAIQRCLTKCGTARNCQFRLNKYTKNCCLALSDYHFDIIRDPVSDTFLLSTLSTETIIVDGIVLRRKSLSDMEKAERTRLKLDGPASNIRCECHFYSDQLVEHQENRGIAIQCGIVELKNGAQVQVGCVSFTFKRS